MARVTICAECKHCVVEGSVGREGIDTAGLLGLRIRCARNPHRDLVTGQPVMRDCRDKNHGHCADFEGA